MCAMENKNKENGKKNEICCYRASYLVMGGQIFILI